MAARTSKTSSGTGPPPLQGRGSMMLCSMPAPPFITDWQLLKPSCGSQSSPLFCSSSLRCVSQIFRQGLQPSYSHACLQSLANFWLIDNTWPESVRPTLSTILTTQPQAVILLFFSTCNEAGVTKEHRSCTFFVRSKIETRRRLFA